MTSYQVDTYSSHSSQSISQDSVCYISQHIRSIAIAKNYKMGHLEIDSKFHKSVLNTSVLSVILNFSICQKRSNESDNFNIGYSHS